jgi:hypothetical protein
MMIRERRRDKKGGKVTIDKVLHRVLYPRRTKMDSNYQKALLSTDRSVFATLREINFLALEDSENTVVLL